jgi:hypothetical protein
MVEVLISLPPSGKDMRGVFYLLSLGEVVRPVSASHKSLGVVTFLNLLTYLVYNDFGRVSSPVFFDFV